ncbi:S41 family peptidase [Chryseobacterium chendengshani]|uniref:S41 family peptidase n=1 Tax=Chryseobacterium sp. LJ756 TaxID=2864113 RepID=UPI001C63B957|nr:S41 family peptidase [Chryseobacterium sp. LJ756]MBW7674839.1 S41 family peptidase [Chryseobacterium sp. LJ756]
MKHLLFLIFILLVTSCASIKKENKHTQSTISPEKLHQDVDFAYRKLQEMHPKLNWYISEKELYFKFDSLKKTIKRPLTPIQFYFKLQPVIAKIREGHLSLKIPMKKFSRKEIKMLKNKKGLFGRFEYHVEKDHLYIIKNKDSVENIIPGTEILSINKIPVSDYLKKYRELISSDGYNTTFQNYYLKDVFFNFYVAEKGILDSANIETSYQNQKRIVKLRRESKNKEDLEKDQMEKKRTEEKKVNDYVASTSSYNRNFKFLDKDSMIAYMKIQSFSRTFSDRFYKESFSKINKAGSSYLIIDIRNNYGGSLYEINNLYSYLAPEPFVLVKPSQLTSKFTPLKTNYFRKSNLLQYILKGLLYPGYVFSQIFSVYKGKDGMVYYRMKENKPTKPKKNVFKGKVYMLINGGSFSASSVISSKLQYDKRATLVGEETGGANDGTVAGFYSYQKLPNSKIDFPIGLLLIQPNIDFTNTKKGVIPDVEISENMQDILNRKDVQLDWIKNDITQNKANKIQN